MRSSSRGFTLVEILIVVIILGILAAIVIPQFTNASNDARNSSVASTLQTVRSQIELFKIQHNDCPPQNAGMTAWALLLNRTDTADTTSTTAGATSFGPYLQQAPVNPVNGKSAVSTAAGADTSAGWYFTATTTGYTMQARNLAGSPTTAY